MSVLLSVLLLLSDGGGVEAAARAEAVGSVPVSHVEAKTALRSSYRLVRATWYCLAGRSRCTRGVPASCLCAAISPDLRRWAGSSLLVSYGGRSVRVRIVDCLCSRMGGIDLYASAFRRLAPLSVGVLRVQIRR